jgi:hypothetical protein
MTNLKNLNCPAALGLFEHKCLLRALETKLALFIMLKFASCIYCNFSNYRIFFLKTSKQSAALVFIWPNGQKGPHLPKRVTKRRMKVSFA